MFERGMTETGKRRRVRSLPAVVPDGRPLGGMRAAGVFPAAECGVVCTEAPPGGQREALTTLRSTPRLCAWCRAVGAFPAAECGVPRAPARWPTRGVDHPTIDSVPVCLV